jgi:hypothetical protein
MVDHPLRQQIHLNRLSQKPGPPQQSPRGGGNIIVEKRSDEVKRRSYQVPGLGMKIMKMSVRNARASENHQGHGALPVAADPVDAVFFSNAPSISEVT